jgi:hypothetical protein
MPKAGAKVLGGAVCCKAMNWLPSLRALIIFGALMVLFAAAYWACGGHGKVRTSSAHIAKTSEIVRSPKHDKVPSAWRMVG